MHILKQYSHACVSSDLTSTRIWHSQSICRALKSWGNWMCLSCAHVAINKLLISTAAGASRASMLYPQSSGHRPVYFLDLQAHLGDEIQHKGLKL